MFKIDCFVEDKNLVTALRGLSGLALDLKVVPVVNAVVKNNKVVGQEGTMIERFTAEWRRRGGHKIVAAEAREMAKAIGLAPTSYGHMLHNSVKAGRVTKAGKTGKSGTGFIYALKDAK